MDERLVQLMKLKGLTAMKFAEMLDVQPSNISHILSGRNKPSYDFIVKLLERFTDVNPHWLLLGVGDVYNCKDNGDATLFTNVNIVASPQETPLFEKKMEERDEAVPRSQFIDGETLPFAAAQTDKKEVVKIILFYSDKSFEVFDNR